MKLSGPSLPLLAVMLLLTITQPVASSYLGEIGGEFLVDYGSSPLVLEQLAGYGCRLLRVFDLFGIALVECPKSVESVVRKVATPNYEVSKAGVSLRVIGTISESGNYGGGYTTAWSWAVSRVGADMVWNYYGASGKGLVVAILDTGVDPDHPLLAGKLFTTDPADPRYPGGWIEFDRKGRPVCSEPRDTDGHGTWVSSMLVGGDTSVYVFGVVPDALLMVASVLPGGYGTFAQVLAGLEWVLRPYDCYKRYVEAPRPLVVSMSIGALGNYSNVFLPAIKRLIQAGIVAVAAIGNGGPYSSSNPGNIWGVVGVGATDPDDKVAYFSSYEVVEWPSPPDEWPFKGQYPKSYAKPDVIAPGVEVVGAFPGALLAIGSGTSASTPLTAGVAAMIAGELRKKGVSGAELVEAVYDVLTGTAARSGDPGSGYGRVRSYAAVSSATNTPVRYVPVSVIPANTRPNEKVSVVAGIPPGGSVDVYISGVRVYSGLYPASGVSVTVPLTHIGGNTVTVISSDGRVYGESLVSVSPVLLLANNMTSGSSYDLVISGLGFGDTVAVYLSGNILVLDSSDLRGTLRSKLLAPYVASGRYFILSVRDYSIPGLSLSTTVFVTPPVFEVKVEESLVAQTRVSVKSQYSVGEVSSIEIYLPQEGFNVSLRQVFPDKPVLKVVNVSIEKNLAVFLVNITNYPDSGVVFVEVSACYKDKCAKSLEPLNVVAVNPMKQLLATLTELEKRVSELTSSLSFERERLDTVSAFLDKLGTQVRDILKELSRLSASLVYVDASLTNLTSRVSSLEREVVGLVGINMKQRVEKVEEGLEKVRGSYSDLSERVAWLNTVVAGAFLVSLIALALALATLLRYARISSRR